MGKSLYTIIGPLGFPIEGEYDITVLRIHTQCSVEVETARDKDTGFGKVSYKR